MSIESHELYKSKCNQVAPCHLVMSLELHYAEIEHSDEDDHSCGYEHGAMENEIHSFIQCTNHKGDNNDSR